MCLFAILIEDIATRLTHRMRADFHGAPQNIALLTADSCERPEREKMEYSSRTGSRSDASDVRLLVVAENSAAAMLNIWQIQSYWPLKGWMNYSSATAINSTSSLISTISSSYSSSYSSSGKSTEGRYYTMTDDRTAPRLNTLAYITESTAFDSV